jgi:hypothetical protein
VNGNTTTFTMDLNAGLTQALSDGTKAYIYGNGRIAQAAGSGTEYFLDDALGSVRQFTCGFHLFYNHSSRMVVLNIRELPVKKTPATSRTRLASCT